MAYTTMTDNLQQKERMRFDMKLDERPRVGMLGRPNSVERFGRSAGDDGLRALMGGSLMGSKGRR